MNDYTNEEVVAIAKKQKVILWLIVASVACALFPPAFIVVAIVNLVFVYQLAKALRLGLAWLWCASQIIPIVSLVALLVLNGKATGAIRSKGITVGFMGANKEQVSALTEKTPPNSR